MARSHALSVWAKESKGKQRVQKTARPTSAQKGLNKQLALWRLRGMLYGATTLAFIAANTWGEQDCTSLCLSTNIVQAAMGYAPYHKLPILWPALPILVLLSIWYTAWDPTYASLRRAQVQGQEVRLRGRGTHIVRLWCPSALTSPDTCIGPTTLCLALKTNLFMLTRCGILQAST